MNKAGKLLEENVEHAVFKIYVIGMKQGGMALLKLYKNTQNIFRHRT
jgi:hypothetical protein